MRQANLIRIETDEFGTRGKVSTGTFECYSIERPASGDHPCIPAGTYRVEKKQHPIHGLCYEVTNVKDRTAILIHPSNWFFQLLGCIALGAAILDIEIPEAVATKFGYKPGTKMIDVSSSKDAVARFEADMENEPFMLNISWAPGVGPQEKTA